MAKIKGAMASGSLGSGGAFDKLNTGSYLHVSADSVRIRPSLIDPSAGNVRFTPRPTQRIQPNTTLNSAASAADTIVDAAFRYQERQEQVEADQGVLKYTQEMRNKFYGYTDKDGNYTAGYNSLESEDAVKGFQEHAASIDTETKDFLMQYPEGVRLKMMLRVNKERQTAHERAISHRMNQFNVWEENTRAAERQDIMLKIDEQHDAPFNDGTVEAHLNKYKNPDQRQKAEEKLATEALYSAYNKALEKAMKDKTDMTPQLTAANAAVKVYGGIRDGLEAETNTKLQHWILSQQATAEHAARSVEKSRQESRIKDIEHDAPQFIAEGLISKDPQMVADDITQFRKLYPTDAEEGSKQVVSAISSSLDVIAANTPGGVTEKYAAAAAAYGSLFTEGVKSDLSKVEEIQIGAHLENVRKGLVSRQNAIDTDDLARLSIELGKFDAEDKPYPLTEKPTNMLVENEARWRKMIATHNSGVGKAYDGETIEEHRSAYAWYYNATGDRALTEAEKRKLSDIASNNKAFQKTFDQILARSKRLEKNPDDKPVYEKDGSFIATKAAVKVLSKVVAGDEPIKKDFASDQEFNKAKATWTRKSIMEEYRARKSMEEWAANNPGNLRMDEWYDSYIKNTVNKFMAITPPSKWSIFKDALGISPSILPEIRQNAITYELGQFDNAAQLSRTVSGMSERAIFAPLETFNELVYGELEGGGFLMADEAAKQANKKNQETLKELNSIIFDER